MLELLDYQISSCTKCNLHKNGRCKPSWSPTAEYAVIGEAPGRDEILKGKPFIGRAGQFLWFMMKEYNLQREQFLVINSVNCRPVSGGKNGKPTETEQKMCREWVRKYLKVLNPKKVILLGEYAMFSLTGKRGITKYNGKTIVSDEFNMPFVACVHPAYATYNPDEAIPILMEGIKSFYEK